MAASGFVFGMPERSELSIQEDRILPFAQNDEFD
jgi:hypothetical protein